jgi:dihydrofolate reductase
VILSIQTTLDGYIEGPNGDMSWMDYNDDEAWNNIFTILTSVDTILVGRKMYAAYSGHWRAVLANPSAPANEIKYARIADKTQHLLFSSTLNKVDWKNTRIVNNVEQHIPQLKQQPGKDMLLLGGSQLISSFVNLDLIDEYRIRINPLALGDGIPLFKDIQNQHRLELLHTQLFRSGVVSLHYKRT